LGWLVVIIVVLFVATLPMQREARKMPASAMRDTAPGRFAKLGQGVTHYQWIGPARGPVLVAIHGLTTPSPVFYALAEIIGKLGYRVLVYDLYGRGFSDAPRGPQTSDFFITQLEELLAHLELKEDLVVMGYSMGGAIATAFTARHPGRVSRLVLLASAGVRVREDRFTRFCRTTPVLGDWVHAMFAEPIARRYLRPQLGKSFDVRGIIELQLSEFSGRGYQRSVLSSLRHMLRHGQEDDHRLIGREGVPVIGIWAEKDEVIPLSSLGTLTQWNRAVLQEVVSGADHRVPFTHASEVGRLLAAVLREVK